MNDLTSLVDMYRLAVRPDPRRVGGNVQPGYAIVSILPISDVHQLVGYKRGYGELHSGLYAYHFRTWQAAARVAHEIADSGHYVFQGQDT